MASKPVCIDIYHGDDIVDLSMSKAFGINFLWHKCTEGLSPDPLYLHRRRLGLDAGIVNFGAYAFFHGADPIAEAAAFVKYAEVDETLALAIDWENLRDGSYASAAKAAAFIEHTLDLTGRDSMWVYGGNVLKEAIIGHDAAARAYWSKQKLWLAQYAEHPTPPLAWARPPDLWQNNGDNTGPGPHHIPGIRGLCDNSCIVVGTEDDLEKKWAG